MSSRKYVYRFPEIVKNNEEKINFKFKNIEKLRLRTCHDLGSVFIGRDLDGHGDAPAHEVCGDTQRQHSSWSQPKRADRREREEN